MKRHLWICPVCGSDEVQEQSWINPNTKEILDSCDRYDWCDYCFSEGRDGEVTLDFVTFYGPLQEVIA